MTTRTLRRTAFAGALLLGIGLGSFLALFWIRWSGASFVYYPFGPTCSKLAMEMAEAVAAPDVTVLEASATGAAGQCAVLDEPLQDFPTDSGSYVLLSTGDVSDVPAGGASGSAPEAAATRGDLAVAGHAANDIVTLSITVAVPPDATTLSFDWKFGTDEGFGTSFQDFFSADGLTVTVDSAFPLSSCPPVPGDVRLTCMVRRVQTHAIDVTGLSEYTINMELADELDDVVDSVAFIDNLTFFVRPTPTPCPPGKVPADGGCGTPTPTPSPTLTPAPPAKGNDDFAGVVLVPEVPYSNKEDTTGATDEPGEPEPCAGIGRAVWYSFTPSASGVLQADTQGSNFDTALAVYTGSGLATLETVSCDDDSGVGPTSLITFAASAGTTYYFQAGGFGGGFGNLVFNLSEPPTPTPTATPTSTPTPCGAPGPTCTPTPTQTLTPTPTPREDGTMSITVSAGGTCVGSKCTVPLNGAFTLQVNAVAPPTEGYIGIQTEVEYAGLVVNGGRYKPKATAGDEIAWVDSAALELRFPVSPTGMEGLVNHGAATSAIPPFPVSHAAGALLQLDFNCGGTSSSNVINLVPYADDNRNASAYKGAGVGFPNIPARVVGGPVTVNCVSGPTATPCGAPGPTCTPTFTPTPTATPTATPTPNPTPTPRDDGTMSITVTSGGTCAGSKCTVPLNGAFTLQVNAVVPPAEGYIGIQTEVEYTDLVASGGRYKPRATAGDEIVWVDSSAFELRIPAAPTGMEGLINHGASTGTTPPFPISNAVGALVQLDFDCGGTNSSNVLTLVPIGATPPPDAPVGYGGPNASGYKGAGVGFPNIPAKATLLTVNCGAAAPTGTPPPPTSTPPVPTPTPTGTPLPTPTPAAAVCADVTGNGLVNIFDILAIALRLGSANAKYDLDGNGRVTVFDVLVAASQLGTHCTQ